ncbi:unnamed protein product [Ostreobium quekettii]|uniref:BZIP domain-containing protein n=1 Tax=Ostreobium quekettii TaxID=121088 RepID=A0A8S1IXP3_9CHLO|nr:unnamed protein product [Ostreobium quekettii]|eukprot:evm.model.scf_3.2 EVM.evm.TU.scf_3.2   scf_3:45328-46208(+)
MAIAPRRGQSFGQETTKLAPSAADAARSQLVMIAGSGSGQIDLAALRGAWGAQELSHGQAGQLHDRVVTTEPRAASTDTGMHRRLSSPGPDSSEGCSPADPRPRPDRAVRRVARGCDPSDPNGQLAASAGAADQSATDMRRRNNRIAQKTFRERQKRRIEELNDGISALKDKVGPAGGEF